MERAIELYACIQCVVIGLSHLLQPRAWAQFFILLRAQGHAGVFANAFLSLLFGAFVVSFHNVWSGLPVVLTALGWAQVVKALVAFVAPAVSLRGMQRVSLDRAWEFQAAGVLLIAVGGVLALILVRG